MGTTPPPTEPLPPEIVNVTNGMLANAAVSDVNQLIADAVSASNPP